MPKIQQIIEIETDETEAEELLRLRKLFAALRPIVVTFELVEGKALLVQMLIQADDTVTLSPSDPQLSLTIRSKEE